MGQGFYKDSSMVRLSFFQTYGIIKRFMDLLVATIGTVLFSPLLFLISAVIYFEMGRPIFFFQKRGGLNGTVFTIYKFRTMRNLRDPHGHLLPEENRITLFGSFLRATSLDELPELFNVLKNDMSLVGPRPFVADYLSRYTPQQARRHEVKPGITGWAQINGRNQRTWDEKFSLDLWYIEHRSFFLDFFILLVTPFKIFTRKGIRQINHTSMEEFFPMKPMELFK